MAPHIISSPISCSDYPLILHHRIMTLFARICSKLLRVPSSQGRLDSYSKLMEACADTTASHEKWLTKLTISSWLTHVKEVLNCGCLVAQCVAQVQGTRQKLPIQLKSEKKAPLLNKPYENEVTMRRQKPPLKCC